MGWFVGYLGLSVGVAAGANEIWPQLLKRFGLFAPNFSTLREVGSLVVGLLALVALAPWYLRIVREDLAPLLEETHLAVRKGEFMVHTGNPDEPVAMARIRARDGTTNVSASLDETVGGFHLEWAYGPDINHLATGDRDFRARDMPRIESAFAVVENVAFDLASYDEELRPPLGLDDLATVRGFLERTGIPIEEDRRITE